MKINRRGTAVWSGGLKDGKGAITTQSGALKEYPYGFATRFEGVPGTNPEELLGAAHAGCFTMALSATLGRNGFTPTRIETKAIVKLEKQGEAFVIPNIDLETSADVPNISDEEFQKLATSAKENCPVSKVLAGAEISLKATLISAE